MQIKALPVAGSDVYARSATLTMPKFRLGAGAARSPVRCLDQDEIPARWASITSWARSRASSLVSRWLTWVLTVE